MKTTTQIADGVRSVLLPATLSIFSGAMILLSGCSSEPDSHLVSAPPPSSAPMAASTPVVVQTPATAGSASPSQNTVIVTQAPPAPQQEVALEQPSPQHVWIPGYWQWRDNRYVWIAGRWELPPRSDAVWVAPRWEQEGNAYRYYDGYWK